MKIHYKIVIPFISLFVVATLVLAIVSISLIARTLQLRVESQVKHVSEMISHSDFALNPSILEKLKTILDAEIVTYGRDGAVIAATLTEPGEAGLLAAVRSQQVTSEILDRENRLVIRRITYDQRPYTIAYRPLPSPPDTVVAFVMPTSDVARAKEAMVRNIAIIAAVVTLLMALLSQVVARSITSPLHRLVDFSKRVAAGDRSGRADIRSRDEIGNLASAFNEMVDQLQASEAKLLRSQTLAVAGQLAAGVAHEIRNPLSSIKMQAQLLRAKLTGTPGNLALARCHPARDR